MTPTQYLAAAVAYVAMTALLYGIDRVFHDGSWLPKKPRRASVAMAVGFPIAMAAFICALMVPASLFVYAFGG